MSNEQQEEFEGAFGETSDRRAPCPSCKRETRVDTLFQKFDRWTDTHTDISGIVEHYVFQCRGCENVIFARSTGNSEDYVDIGNHLSGDVVREYVDHKTFWPIIPQVQIPNWAMMRLMLVDETLAELLHSVYSAMNNNLPVLAAIGMRTTFDRVSELLNVDTHISFDDKLETLRKEGYISGTQKGILEVLINAGSAAAHRGWKPTEAELNTMKEILETLIKDQFITRDEVKKLARRIPKK